MLICMRRADEGEQKFRKCRVVEAATLWKVHRGCYFEEVLSESPSTGMWAWDEYSIDGKICTFILHAPSCAAPALKASSTFTTLKLAAAVRSNKTLSRSTYQKPMMGSGSLLNLANLPSKSVFYNAKKKVLDEQLEQYIYHMRALKPYLSEYKSKNLDLHVVLKTLSENCFQRCLCFMLVDLLVTKYSPARNGSFCYR